MQPSGRLTGTITTEASPGDAECYYWRSYLSPNGRQVYRATAEVERSAEPDYTLADRAEQMDREYRTAQSMHLTIGRSARKWKDDTGTDAPIELEWIEYVWTNPRAVYGRRAGPLYTISACERSGANRWPEMKARGPLFSLLTRPTSP
jgi:hypothetical protein